MIQGLINTLLNFAAPPFTFFSLLLFWPPFQAFKSFLSILRSLFKEDVAGKVVIITGASSGIGEHLAYEYARRGACLVLAARRENILLEVADRAFELGAPDVVPIPADVANLDDCRRIVDQTMNHFGRLDHLVNNAGMMAVSMFEEVENITAFEQIMDINFWGSVYMTRFALPYLRHSKGRVIVLSSSASWLPAPRFQVYNASKAALLQFFDTLRIEFGPDIGVTIVTPGFIESELTQGKYIGKSGNLEIDTEMRDAQVSFVPAERADACTRAIVNGACRGDRYVTEPQWFKYTYFWKAFCPEVVDFVYRILYVGGTYSSPTDAMGKKLVDYTGADKILYPETIRAPQAKTE